MKGSEKGKLTAADFDLRVRDRHLAAGVLDAKVVARYLSELPDLDALVEKVPYEQPALADSSDEDDEP